MMDLSENTRAVIALMRSGGIDVVVLPSGQPEVECVLQVTEDGVSKLWEVPR
jgi:hypothetical protein